MDKKLRIAFLSFFSGVSHRGVETLIEELAPRLAGNNEVIVFQSGKRGGNGYKVEHIPVSWKPDILEHPLTVKRRLFLDQTSLAIHEFTKKVLPFLKREKFDIVVPWNNGWQTLICRTSSVGKVVVVGQSGLGWDDRVNLWVFPDVFVGFTSYQYSWAKKVNPFVKVEQIANGVDGLRFKPEGPKINLNLPRPIILSVAALVPMKRLHLAIKAVSRLKDGSLVLAGKGELKEELQKTGNSLLGERFKILEFDYDDIPKIYRSCDLFTYPTSSWESFGIALLEAMAMNLPIVANDDPIRREIVGDAGLFVDPTDTQGYADALQKALDMEWGNKPRKQTEKFSWDKIAKQYEELFRELK